MKKEYVTPVMVGAKFVANEYVAACITGTIQCIYPGKSSSKYDDGTKTYIDSQGLWHGLCGNDATISFNGETASGYERINNVAQTDRPIYNIKGYEEKEGTYYDVTWTSKETAANQEYNHKGRLVITNIDNKRPNHS
ncbi:MAG: hypothetical protein SOU03_12540 [Dorea sp.]|nr:hypothetical protein [Dorea sp.]